MTLEIKGIPLSLCVLIGRPRVTQFSGRLCWHHHHHHHHRHQVEMVRPPEGSVVGERARVEGSEGEPITPAQVCSSDTAV